MRRSNSTDDTGVVSMDRAKADGRPSFAGAGYRLAAGGLGRRWTPGGETPEEPCLEDEFVAHTARAWTSLRGVAAKLPDATRAGVAVAAGQAGRVPLAIVVQATAVCAMATIGASTLLYWQKSRTARVDHEIGHVVGEMAQAEAQTGRLRAQWLALNDPARLGEAAGRYAGLRPLAPAQFVDASKLADHLPAPGAVPVDSGAEAASQTDIAGGATPVMKAITAQPASLVARAVPEPPPSAPDAAVPRARVDTPTQTAADMGRLSPGTKASAPQAHSDGATSVQVDDATAEASVRPASQPSPPAQPSPAAQLSRHLPRAPSSAWVSAGAVAPRSVQTVVAVRAAAALRANPVPVAHPMPAVPPVSSARLAASAARAPLAVIHSVGTPFRVASPAAIRPDPRPRPAPRMLMARYDMPRWLLETHPPHPATMVMSAPPHMLGVPHDQSVLQPGPRHGGEPELAVKSEPAADDHDDADAPAAEEVQPAPVLRRPGYRPYYNYGYGYRGPYGNGYPPNPRYYQNGYGGYTSQPYGGQYAPGGYGGQPYYQ